MHRRDHGTAARRLHGAPALLRHAKGLAHDRLSRRRAQADDDLRLDKPNFLLQPGMTRPNLGVVRLLMDATPAFAAALPLEVLHRVGDVDVVAVDTCLLERAVEQLPRRADERMASAVLLIAGLL